MPLLAATFLMSLLPACSDDTPEPDASENKDQCFWLSLYMGCNALDYNPNTRASYEICNHNKEDDTSEERYISPNDITILLFDKDKRCFHKITDISNIFLSKQQSAENDNLIYRAIFRLSFEDLLPIENHEFFYIAIVANSQGTNGGDQKFNGDFSNKTFTDIANMNKTFSITGSKWLPDGKNNRIPMSGFAKVKKPSADKIEFTNIIAPCNLCDMEGNDLAVDMLRAMCKIRFVDQIANNDSVTKHPILKNVSIKSITLQGHDSDRCGFNKQGTYLPNWRAMEAWQDNEKTTMSNYCAHPTNVEDWSGNNKKIELQKMSSSYSDNQFIAYIPENVLIDGGYWSKHRIPKIYITTQSIIDGASFEKEWELNLTDVLQNKDMVRNHIYEFKVLMRPADNLLQINYSVCKWNEASTTIEFN